MISVLLLLLFCFCLLFFHPFVCDMVFVTMRCCAASCGTSSPLHRFFCGHLLSSPLHRFFCGHLMSSPLHKYLLWASGVISIAQISSVGICCHLHCTDSSVGICCHLHCTDIFCKYLLSSPLHRYLLWASAVISIAQILLWASAVIPIAQILLWASAVISIAQILLWTSAVISIAQISSVGICCHLHCTDIFCGHLLSSPLHRFFFGHLLSSPLHRYLLWASAVISIAQILLWASAVISIAQILLWTSAVISIAQISSVGIYCHLHCTDSSLDICCQCPGRVQEVLPTALYALLVLLDVRSVADSSVCFTGPSRCAQCCRQLCILYWSF